MRKCALAFLFHHHRLMDIGACYKVGYILKPHGLKGGVTVSLDAEAPDFDGLDTLFIQRDNRLVPHFIESVSVRGDKAFVKFEDVDSPEGANAISKCALYLPKSMRPKSGKGDFYDDEVIGFEATDSTLGTLGNVIEVVQAGPNKLLAIDHNGKEVLIPVNGPFITSINKSKKKISVTLPEGFLDI
jgi:16S rRNA processing protein RimM